MPAPIALAATFAPEFAGACGGVIGHEARALGQDVLLSPMVNQIRTPCGGRNFEWCSTWDHATCRAGPPTPIAGCSAAGNGR